MQAGICLVNAMHATASLTPTAQKFTAEESPILQYQEPTRSNQERWQTYAKSKQFDSIRSHMLIETQGEHLLHVLQKGTVAERSRSSAASPFGF